MTEPTDAELDELRQANGGKLNFVTFSEFRTIARAVLAKWGAQPVPTSAAEFALRALVAAGHVSQELVDRAITLPGAPQAQARSGEPVGYTHASWITAAKRGGGGHFAGRQTPGFDVPLYLASQSVSRKPLTDEQIQEVVTKAVRKRKLSWLGFKKDDKGEYTIPVLSPSDYQMARAIERAHGITGGQHGAE